MCGVLACPLCPPEVVLELFPLDEISQSDQDEKVEGESNECAELLTCEHEDLTEEGELEIRVWIRKSGEVNKVKTERGQGGIKDKVLVEETEGVLYGMEFSETDSGNITLLLKLKFTNRSKGRWRDTDEW